MIQSKNTKNEWTKTEDIVFRTDIYASYQKNDVSIISLKAFQEAKQSTVKGYCHNRFQPNLVVSMSRDEEIKMKVGVELGINGVKLFVLSKKHRCHGDCPLFIINRQSCDWTNHIYYAGIIKGGKVIKGCTVMI